MSTGRDLVVLPKQKPVSYWVFVMFLVAGIIAGGLVAYYGFRPADPGLVAPDKIEGAIKPPPAEVHAKTRKLPTFTDQNGIVWTVTSGDVAPPSRLIMDEEATKACPGLRVKLELSKDGPAMTKKQKFRGDKRHHIACDRTSES